MVWGDAIGFTRLKKVSHQIDDEYKRQPNTCVVKLTTQDEIRAVYKRLNELGEKRSERAYAWLRWLVLLAAGAFSVLVSQVVGDGAALRGSLPVLKIAMCLNAGGILCGVVCLFGEVQAVRRLVAQEVLRLKYTLDEQHEHAASVPSAASPSWWIRKCEAFCYIFLAGSLLAWVYFVLLL